MEKEFTVKGKKKTIEVLEPTNYRTRRDLVAAAMSRAIDRMVKKGRVHPFDAAKMRKKHVADVVNVMSVAQHRPDKFQESLPPLD